MLKHIRLIDFKSFVDEQVDLAPLTLLVGANASGKSNLFDAMRFLSMLPEKPIANILNGNGGSTTGEDWAGIRGKAAEAARFGCDAFELRTDWRANVDKEVADVWHRIRCRTLPDASILTEGAGYAGKNTLLASPPPPPPRYANKPYVPFSFAASFLRGPSVGEYERCAVFLRWSLARVHPIDVQPGPMRRFGRRGQALGPHGDNLSGVLADLCADPEERRAFIDWLAELCAPELSDLDFIEVPELGDVMAVAIERGGKRISARSLSDGTLRFLGLLVALRTAEPGSCLLVEEIDAGLHPTRIRLLVEYLQAVTRERGIQVIATTHSPAVLQWLSNEVLRGVVLFAVVPEREGTLMRRLGDLPHFDEVVKRTGIEELFSTGWLEMAV